MTRKTCVGVSITSYLREYREKSTVQSDNVRMMKGVENADFSLHLLHHVQLIDAFLVHDLDCHLDTGDEMCSHCTSLSPFQLHVSLFQKSHSPKCALIGRVQRIRNHWTSYSQNTRGIHRLSMVTTITACLAERRFVQKIVPFYGPSRTRRANRQKTEYHAIQLAYSVVNEPVYSFAPFAREHARGRRDDHGRWSAARIRRE